MLFYRFYIDLKAKFYLFVDDDVYVNPRLLISFLESDSVKSVKESLYAGRVIYNALPYRNIKSKWYVSPEEYKEEMYPPFIPAGFILFSSLSLPRFYNASKYNKLFILDDIYLAILAHSLGIQPIHMNSVVSYRKEDIEPRAEDIVSYHPYSPDKLIYIWEEKKNQIKLNQSIYEDLLESC